MSADDFESLGLELIFGENDPIVRRKENYRQQKFKQCHAKSPEMVAVLWKEIIHDRWILRKTNGKPQPRHLLWALNFMQDYEEESPSSDGFNCDEKTWRKWTWIYVTAMSRLAGKFVSNNSIVAVVSHYFHMLLLTKNTTFSSSLDPMGEPIQRR